MATAHLAMPFLQKDNKKSSSNQQIPENFLKLLSKNGGKRKKKKMLILMSTNLKFFLFIEFKRKKPQMRIK